MDSGMGSDILGWGLRVGGSLGWVVLRLRALVKVEGWLCCFRNRGRAVSVKIGDADADMLDSFIRAVGYRKEDIGGW